MGSPPPAITYRIDPFPADAELGQLWRRAWRAEPPPSFAPILARSLAHLGAYAGVRLIGFVNVAWDGGEHAFLLDPIVDPDSQRQGIGTALVAGAVELARQRGAGWLHVDFEPHLEPFYRASGFEPTTAGLIRLR